MSGKLRAVAAALAFCAVAFAVGLSAAPQLHEWLHNIGDRPNHECAATLLSSGSIQHSDCQPIPTCPENVPVSRTFRAQPFARVLAFLEFSLLEHAPPAHS